MGYKLMLLLLISTSAVNTGYCQDEDVFLLTEARIAIEKYSNYKAALSALEKMSTVGKADPLFIYYSAVANEGAGNLDKAIDFYKKYYQQNPKPELIEKIADLSYQLGKNSLRDGIVAFNAGDYEKAFPLIKFAADKGEIKSYYYLGMIYMKRYNYKEANVWFMKGANSNDSKCQRQLGVNYRNGQGIGQDSNEGIKWYRAAAGQGDSLAAYFLGLYYQNNLKNAGEASNWYSKAAERGYPPAQFSLGKLYELGEGGIKMDIEKAKYWYQKAANQGHTEAKTRLGTMNH